MAPPIAHGSPGLLHLAVGDADRAVAFFGNLFGWGGERSVADTVSWYPLNTTVTVRLIADGRPLVSERTANLVAGAIALRNPSRGR